MKPKNWRMRRAILKVKIETDAHGNPILHQLSEEGFVDLLFRVTNLVDDGPHYRFHLSASYGGSPVGMNVVVVKGIRGGFDENLELVPEHIYRKGVRFLRSGDESDRLLAAIGELYGCAEPPGGMVEEETFTGIALHQGPLEMESERVKIKIFGRDSEPIDENAYYESFFNLDLPNGYVFWNEKDVDYRGPLLRGLTVQG